MIRRLLAGLVVIGGGAALAEDVVPEPIPPGIQVVMTEQGPVYADQAGKTLYTWGGDNQPGKSLCNDDRPRHVDGAGQIPFTLPEPDQRLTCQQIWPAAIAKSAPVGNWTHILRKDGSKQWAYDTKPLYTTVFDTAPGEARGADLLFNTRKPLQPKPDLPAGVTSATTIAGRVLTTTDGATLYTYAADTAHRSACEEECAKLWPPLAAPALAINRGAWTVVSRKDGLNQWAYKGKPLYTYNLDEGRRDLAGAEVPKWSPAVVQPPPARPADITVVMTSAGETFADKSGMTVYTFACNEDGAEGLSCDQPGTSLLYRLTICGGAEKCMTTWRPVPAPPNARNPSRTWTVVELDPKTGERLTDSAAHGLRAWAYNGRPLYTFAQDQQPGDYNGHHIRVWPTRFFLMLRPSGAGAF